MKKIDEQIKLSQMSETERLIKELKSKRVSDKEVEARVNALHFK